MSACIVNISLPLQNKSQVAASIYQDERHNSQWISLDLGGGIYLI